MAKYALVVNDVVKEFRKYDKRPADIPHKKIVWLLVVEETVNNAATIHVVKTRTTSIADGKYIILTTISDRPTEEVTAEEESDRDARIDRVDGLILDVLFELANDVRVIKGQSAVTKAQFRTYLRSKL